MIPFADANLMQVSGVDDIEAYSALKSAGFETISDLRDCRQKELRGLDGLWDIKAARIKSDVGWSDRLGSS